MGSTEQARFTHDIHTNILAVALYILIIFLPLILQIILLLNKQLFYRIHLLYNICSPLLYIHNNIKYFKYHILQQLVVYGSFSLLLLIQLLFVLIVIVCSSVNTTVLSSSSVFFSR